MLMSVQTSDSLSVTSLLSTSGTNTQVGSNLGLAFDTRTQLGMQVQVVSSETGRTTLHVEFTGVTGATPTGKIDITHKPLPWESGYWLGSIDVTGISGDYTLDVPIREFLDLDLRYRGDSQYRASDAPTVVARMMPAEIDLTVSETHPEAGEQITVVAAIHSVAERFLPYDLALIDVETNQIIGRLDNQFDGTFRGTYTAQREGPLQLRVEHNWHWGKYTYDYLKDISANSSNVITLNVGLPASDIVARLSQSLTAGHPGLVTFQAWLANSKSNTVVTPTSGIWQFYINGELAATQPADNGPFVSTLPNGVNHVRAVFTGHSSLAPLEAAQDIEWYGDEPWGITVTHGEEPYLPGRDELTFTVSSPVSYRVEYGRMLVSAYILRSGEAYSPNATPLSLTRARPYSRDYTAELPQAGTHLISVTVLDLQIYRLLATNQFWITVLPVYPVLTLSLSHTFITANATTLLTAAASGENYSGADTVQFYSDGKLLGEAPLVDGLAALTLTGGSFSLGPHNITARFKSIADTPAASTDAQYLRVVAEAGSPASTVLLPTFTELGVSARFEAINLLATPAWQNTSVMTGPVLGADDNWLQDEPLLEIFASYLDRIAGQSDMAGLGGTKGQSAKLAEIRRTRLATVRLM